MSEIGYLDDSVFGGGPKIRVMLTEHNGKTHLHRHAFYEFVYIDRGFTLHYHSGKTSILTPGDLFAITPNEAHSYTSSYHTNLYNILFSLEELGGLSDEVLSLPGLRVIPANKRDSYAAEQSSVKEKLNSGPFPVLRVGLPERRNLIDMLEHMKWESETRGIGWKLSLKNYLISFLIFYSRLHGAENKTRESSVNSYFQYIYRALEYIDENYKNDIGGREIADCTGLSQDYIAKQFKAALSMTPSEYIRNFRVAKSMELLKTTDMPAGEIARAVGFGDISLYSRIFKQQIGISPTAFRKGDSK